MHFACNIFFFLQFTSTRVSSLKVNAEEALKVPKMIHRLIWMLVQFTEACDFYSQMNRLLNISFLPTYVSTALLRSRQRHVFMSKKIPGTGTHIKKQHFSPSTRTYYTRRSPLILFIFICVTLIIVCSDLGLNIIQSPYS